ncbi:MAG TPA: DUF3800 domain-containing protein [Solirubrobacterales bacterium]|nr:DUF3800 domain-containing protein [Solirubrobacterales bacterium]
MLEVAFDESGNSGENLLDPAQPVYALASVARPEAEVAGPVAALLDGTSYAELKFSRLRTSRMGRQILAEIFESGLLDPQSSRVVPVDKDWMVAGKMVDLLWEPGAANTHQFYATGMHRQLASGLQRQGPGEAGEENWKRWQDAFIAAVRWPEQEERIVELVAALAAVKASAAGQPVGILFEPVPDDAASLTELVNAGRDALEPALTGLVEQMHHWSQRLREPFRVVHDDSGVVRRWHELLLRFSDREIESSTFDVGDVHFEYPLHGEEIETVDSRDCVAVQLADVLSGAVMWCLRERVRGAEVPPEWQRWDRGRFIDHFQGADDFLLGLVDPERPEEPPPQA